MVGISLRSRHLALGALSLVLGALAFAGCLGPAVGEERITAYDVAAVIRTDGSLQVREVVDYDFGGEERRGIFRRIPTDLGAPIEVAVSSDTAPDDVTTSSLGDEVEVRIGDPDRTVTGRHRYTITYVLPTAIVGDRFAFDAIGNEWPVPIHDVTVTVGGAELGEPRCFTGELGSTDRCDLEEVDGTYRTAVDRLDAHEAITIDGDVVATGPASLAPPPPFAGRSDDARLGWALVVTGLSAATAGIVFVVCRQLGRNEVAGGGATEAAFATGHGTGAFGPDLPEPTTPPPGTVLVADTDMADLAGLEFVPPRGVEPWQASVVLREKLDATTIGAWFASLAGHDIVTIEPGDGSAVRLGVGPRAAEADATVAPILNRALGDRDAIDLGSYDSRFATAWREAGIAIQSWVDASGVFRRRPPRAPGTAASGATPPVACLVPAAFFLVAGIGGSALAGLRTGVAGVLVPIAVAGIASLVAYRRLTRSLSARGSALALRSESFRRFLHDSEAQHVEWAWQNGLLREYSAWAVALGEATAWGAALAASSVPPAEVAAAGGVLSPGLHLHTFSTTTTAPAPSGGSGGGFSGGGFSGGGFSGGGGGGGGGGSW